MSTFSLSHPDPPAPSWDLRVLDLPVVLDVPDSIPRRRPHDEPSRPGRPGLHSAARACAHPAESDEADETGEPDPLTAACLKALASVHDADPQAHVRIGDLGRAGVVALRTSSGSLELHETLLGWILVHSWGDPDPLDLAAAARLRAWRLASERRHSCGEPAPDHGHQERDRRQRREADAQTDDEGHDDGERHGGPDQHGGGGRDVDRHRWEGPYGDDW